MVLTDLKTNKNKDEKTVEEGVRIPINVIEKSESMYQKDHDDQEESVQDKQDYFDQLQRLHAEFDNYRKRIERERAETYQLAKGDLILNLLLFLGGRFRLFVKVPDNNPPFNPLKNPF